MHIVFFTGFKTLPQVSDTRFDKNFEITFRLIKYNYRISKLTLER